MRIPEGLHDTYFMRAMFFKDKKKLEETTQEHHPTDDHTYLKRAQRGHISSAPGVLENKLSYSQNKSSSAIKVDGKNDIVSKLGYKRIDLIPLLDYSKNGNSPYKINSFQGINYGMKKILYNPGNNYNLNTPTINY